MKQEKKEEILAAAAKLFGHFGYKKTSIDEVAKEAGVAKGTVYLAASSKSDLFFQAIHYRMRNCMFSTGVMLDPRFPADQLLGRVLELELGLIQSDPLVQELLLGRVNLNVRGWSERFDELRRMARSNLLEVLRLGQRQGIFRMDLDLEQVAVLLQDIEASTFLFHEKESEVDSPRWKTAIRLFIDGLKTKDALEKENT